MANANKNSTSEVTYRWKLALIITILSIIGIAGIAAIVIIFADNKNSATQTVLTATLPLKAA